MRTVFLTETGKTNHLQFLLRGLSTVFTTTNTTAHDVSNGKYQKISLTIPDPYREFILAEIRQKLAEILVVGYKYRFFKESVRVSGLTAEQKELFLTAIIAADLADDRKYAENHIQMEDEISLDGVYHFRMQRLCRKWEEIVDCLPSYFTEDLYRNFMQYLIDDFEGEQIYIVKDKVFDSHYNRSFLGALAGDSDSLRLQKEILLSCGKEVHLVGPPERAAVEFLKEFYGANVFFHDGASELLC